MCNLRDKGNQTGIEKKSDTGSRERDKRQTGSKYREHELEDNDKDKSKGEGEGEGEGERERRGGGKNLGILAFMCIILCPLRLMSSSNTNFPLH